MTVPSAQRLRMMYNTPGVSSGPTTSAWTPIEHNPAVSALSNIWPDRRVSLPIRVVCGRSSR